MNHVARHLRAGSAHKPLGGAPSPSCAQLVRIGCALMRARVDSTFLWELVKQGMLVPKGERRGRYYHLPDNQKI